MMKLGIMGAGAIGCYVGGRLIAAGADVVLVGRGALGEEVRQHGLRITDDDGFDKHIPNERVKFSTSPDALSGCDAIVVTVKGLATAETARAMRPHVGPGTVVVSLQNGVRNPGVMRGELPGIPVLGAMVPFNVVRKADAHFHRGTSGHVVIEASGGREQPIVRALRAAGIEAAADPDIDGILWGKLLFNLNNPINALAGVPLREELLDRRYRLVLAACIDEGLSVLARRGVVPRPSVRIPVRIVPSILRLPSLAFRLVARPLIRIDAEARSSMWEDLERGRKTEIDFLSGEIVALADALHADAPVNRAIAAAIQAAEAAGRGSPRIGAEALLDLTGLARRGRRRG